jgi:hypothetical protein
VQHKLERLRHPQGYRAANVDKAREYVKLILGLEVYSHQSYLAMKASPHEGAITTIIMTDRSQLNIPISHEAQCRPHVERGCRRSPRSRRYPARRVSAYEPVTVQRALREPKQALDALGLDIRDAFK